MVARLDLEVNPADGTLQMGGSNHSGRESRAAEKTRKLPTESSPFDLSRIVWEYPAPVEAQLGSNLHLEDVEHLRGGRPADPLDGDRLPGPAQRRVELGVHRGDELLEELPLLVEAIRLTARSSQGQLARAVINLWHGASL